MSFKLYYDLLSQPSRALYIFMKSAKIPFEACPVALRNGEHLTEEYKKNVNRFQKVPAIVDNGMRLAESVAIFRYLARESKIDDHWYPKDSKARARVDEYMEWQHNNVRMGCAMYFRLKWLQPLITGKESDPKLVKEMQDKMEEALNLVENEWLGKTNFIAGDTVSVADLLAACEIEQPRMTGFNPCDGRPKLTKWIKLVRESTNPYYDQAHEMLNKVAAKVDPNNLTSKL